MTSVFTLVPFLAAISSTSLNHLFAFFLALA